MERHAPPSWWGRDCGLCPAASVSSPHLWLETSTLAGLSFPREVMMLAASPPSMARTIFSWLALHTCLNQHLRNTGAGVFFLFIIIYLGYILNVILYLCLPIPILPSVLVRTQQTVHFLNNPGYFLFNFKFCKCK